MTTPAPPAPNEMEMTQAIVEAAVRATLLYQDEKCWSGEHIASVAKNAIALDPRLALSAPSPSAQENDTGPKCPKCGKAESVRESLVTTGVCICERCEFRFAPVPPPSREEAGPATPIGDAAYWRARCERVEKESRTLSEANSRQARFFHEVQAVLTREIQIDSPEDCATDTKDDIPSGLKWHFDRLRSQLSTALSAHTSLAARLGEAEKERDEWKRQRDDLWSSVGENPTIPPLVALRDKLKRDLATAHAEIAALKAKVEKVKEAMSA